MAMIGNADWRACFSFHYFSTLSCAQILEAKKAASEAACRTSKSKEYLEYDLWPPCVSLLSQLSNHVQSIHINSHHSHVCNDFLKLIWTFDIVCHDLSWSNAWMQRRSLAMRQVWPLVFEARHPLPARLPPVNTVNTVNIIAYCICCRQKATKAMS